MFFDKSYYIARNVRFWVLLAFGQGARKTAEKPGAVRGALVALKRFGL
ncbi:hypothetical protein [Oceanithermus sp.]